MNLSLSKRLNEIVEQYIPASPGLSESVIEWFNDWQRETSAADHENLREDIRDLKDDVSQIKTQQTFLANDVALLRTEFKDLKDDFKDLKDEFKGLKDDVSQIRDQLTDFKLNTSERFKALEKSILLVRSDSKEQFSALDKSIKINFMWGMLLITGLLFPIVLPHIQTWFHR
jgi:septal ring factor EnvC (AmiA/AmiB activator)